MDAVHSELRLEVLPRSPPGCVLHLRNLWVEFPERMIATIPNETRSGLAKDFASPMEMIPLVPLLKEKACFPLFVLIPNKTESAILSGFYYLLCRATGRLTSYLPMCSLWGVIFQYSSYFVLRACVVEHFSEASRCCWLI